ncbi:hypothetical protein [Agrobacterium rubi]|uniref:Scaffolding protein n=1 Tax=Agrobacterium rubi TaxID=28099 RepID=A0ABX2IXT3_9HYPH|nr:hypothetical protein [Agrobacterium rubi]NTF35557.1 hypothetical protein [Agrobacterium rubi]
MDGNESANLLDNGGSKTVEPSTDFDNSDDFSYWEPEDDENDSDNPAADADETGGETDEANAGQETDEDNVDGEGDDPDADNAGDDDAALDEKLVTLKGGEQVPIKELKLGYMRLTDYRAKTQETANRGRTLNDMSERVSNTAAALANFLVSQLPPEPTHDLAMSHPDQYTRQKAIYDLAAQRVGQILEMANAPKQVLGTLTQDQHQSQLQEEGAKLAEFYPQLADVQKRQQFFNDAFSTARDLGFSDEEMEQVTDHRMFRLAHYARIGLKAEAARKKAMDKVNNAPPPSVRGRAQGGNAQQAKNQKAAIARLDQTGSIKDALKIDWE